MSTEIVPIEVTGALSNDMEALGRHGILTDHNGRLWLFYEQEVESELYLFYYYSDNNGRTWTYSGVGDVSGTELHGTGHWAVDVAPTGEVMAIIVEKTTKELKLCIWDSDGEVFAESSVNDGSAVTAEGPPGLVAETADKLRIARATDSNYLYCTYSEDGGSTWTSEYISENFVYSRMDAWRDFTSGLIHILSDVPNKTVLNIGYPGKWDIEKEIRDLGSDNPQYSYGTSYGKDVWILVGTDGSSGGAVLYRYDRELDALTTIETYTWRFAVGLTRVLDSERVYAFLSYRRTGSTDRVQFSYLKDDGTMSDPEDTTPDLILADTRYYFSAPRVSDVNDIVYYHQDSGDTKIYFYTLVTRLSEAEEAVKTILQDGYRYKKLPRKYSDATWEAREPEWQIGTEGDKEIGWENKDIIRVVEETDTRDFSGIHHGCGYVEAVVQIEMGTDYSGDHRRMMTNEVKRVLRKKEINPGSDKYTVEMETTEYADQDFTNYWKSTIQVIVKYFIDRKEYEREVFT